MKQSIVTNCYLHLVRAFEVAAICGYKINILAENSYANNYVGVKDDYEVIKSTFGPQYFSPDGEIYIQIYKPHPTQVINDLLPGDLERSFKRIEMVRSMELPNNELDSSSEHLLKVAIERVNLTLNDVDQVNRMAQVIAAMDGKKTIGAQHVAEAIHYKCGKTDTDVYSVENSTLRFGNSISIGMDADHYELELALEYIQNKLK